MFPNHDPIHSSMDTTRSSGSDVVTTARGILATGRGYNQRQAFDELMDVAKRQHVSVVSAARQLIDAVQGTSDYVPTEWVELVHRVHTAP
ncbi:hypothetical protein B2J88_35510 [Rhodococcus sp. SRB_17]|nr:hypothetical protein [Rhodococcus sp. SRB_17]OYD71038.1 ANTAR domain-containing protein [Rhodococcus sp. OK302]